MTGKLLSHYRILEELGRGGMGVVYKAEDTRLKRIVAIKFLPQQIAVNTEERERCKTEAQAAAALNHPNLATIHAIEEHGDEIFIVMEFIDGKELRDVVGATGPVALADAIQYAAQIAEGLKAAHAKTTNERYQNIEEVRADFNAFSTRAKSFKILPKVVAQTTHSCFNCFALNSIAFQSAPESLPKTDLQNEIAGVIFCICHYFGVRTGCGQTFISHEG